MKTYTSINLFLRFSLIFFLLVGFVACKKGGGGDGGGGGGGETASEEQDASPVDLSLTSVPPSASVNTGSFSVDGQSFNFNRTPSSSTASDYGSSCRSDHISSIGGVLYISMGSVVSGSGNYNGMSLTLYNYSSSKTSYVINESASTISAIGGTILLVNTSVSNYASTGSRSPKSTCSISAFTSGGRVRGSFSCSNLYKFTSSIGTTGYSASGSFNCKLN